MTSKDKDIWQAYTREVKPTPSRAKVAKPALPKAEISRAAQRNATAIKPVLAVEQPERDFTTSLERKREKAFRTGEMPIEARLDLHGMTQIEAFDALAAFIKASVHRLKRHLLIITGKGSRGAGVLRANLETWLRQLPEASAIIALRPAATKHGGDGAFYVVLRNTKRQ